MNDTRIDEGGAPLSPPSSPPDKPPEVAPPPAGLITVKLIDGRHPFPILAVYRLLAVPRPGDLINIDIQGRRPSYRVMWVNFDPSDTISHVTLGCLPNEIAGSAGQADEAKLKERMDDFIKSQLQIFDKLDAYSKAIMLGAYAGLFAIWSFAKDGLTARTTEWVAILAGISLLIYISWEIVGMVSRAVRHHQFNPLINKSPSEFFKALDDLRLTERSRMIREAGRGASSSL